MKYQISVWGPDPGSKNISKVKENSLEKSGSVSKWNESEHWSALMQITEQYFSIIIFLLWIIVYEMLIAIL